MPRFSQARTCLPVALTTLFMILFTAPIAAAPSNRDAAIQTDNNNASYDGLRDMEALLALKSCLQDPDGNLRSWRRSRRSSEEEVSMAESSQHCSWRGVACLQPLSFAVAALDLSRLNLSGTICDAMSELQQLRSLNISGNAFAGELPSVLTNLTRLQYLDISHNSFNGSLPAGFYRLKSLLNFTAYSNSFTGELPQEFLHLPSLRHFDLSGSYFTGAIPPSYGALLSVEYLDLSGNLLNGTIPAQLGSLPSLRMLRLGWNQISGSIPPELGNLSSTLQCLDLAGSLLSGAIPADLGKLHLLSTLFLYKNFIIGAIPAELGNMSSMVSLDLSQNQLSGAIPASFASLRSLSLLSLMYNNLSGAVPATMAELPELVTFLIWNNSLSGELPQNLGMSSALVTFDASANKLTGEIPPYLCAGGKLTKLMLFANELTGSIPVGLARCPSLWRLRLEGNGLSGTIPAGFGGLKNFTYLDVSHNRLSGPIPADLFEAELLQNFGVSWNPLGSAFPSGVWRMRSLQKLYAAGCGFTGEGVADISQCPPLLALDLSGNRLTGGISPGVVLCQKLALLSLAGNQLSGAIPEELASLPVLSTLDLSRNALTGPIPQGFQNATALEVLDLSYNNLSGTVPSSGLFRVINPSLLAGNDGLCGGILGPCTGSTSVISAESQQQQQISPSLSANDGRTRSFAVWVVGIIIAMAAVMTLVAASRRLVCHCGQIAARRHRRRRVDGGGVGSCEWKLTAFQRLSFTAEDIVRCLTTENIVGMGAAGTVYRAEVPSGEVVAVKKLWRTSQKEERIRSSSNSHGSSSLVLSEVDVLGSVRHRNIVRLLGYCCSTGGGGDETEATTLLLYEYMENGSLGDLLHGGGTKHQQTAAATAMADWGTRYKVAMGVAQGLCYLHHDCFPVIVHRDVKSNNILLDADMEARVADFGLAKLIATTTEAMSVVAGSYGYIAPEYAYTMQVDEKSDVYSYGVVLLELLTGKRPVEAEYYGEGANIAEWVREKVQKGEEVLDWGAIAATAAIASSNSAAHNLTSPTTYAAAAAASQRRLRCLIREEMGLVLRIALLCTSKSPSDRPCMRDVVTMLSEAKPRSSNGSHREYASSGCAAVLPLPSSPPPLLLPD